mgnify:CR=1 FL=1
MARKLTTTVRLDPEDAEALARARAQGLSASRLIRQGLRVVAAKYYRRRRPPSTGHAERINRQLAAVGPQPEER